MSPNPKKIVVTGASGRIGYQLLFLLAKGLLLGNDQPIILSLLEKKSNLKKCQGIRMELEDSYSPLIQSIQYTDDPDYAFAEADFVFFCGAKICHDPQDRFIIQSEIWKALTLQGKSLNRFCSINTLFLMIANPCNTNTLILIKAAPDIPPKNFHALIRLDQNRAYQFIAQKTKCFLQAIEKVIIWGNHSSTVVPDCFHAKIHSMPISSLLDSNWLCSQFIQLVQNRGVEITKARQGLSSCASVAYAAIEAMKALITPTPQDNFFCSGIYSQGNLFGFDQDLVFGLPCRTIAKGSYEIIKECPPHTKLTSLIRLSEAELIEERSRIKR